MQAAEPKTLGAYLQEHGLSHDIMDRIRANYKQVGEEKPELLPDLRPLRAPGMRCTGLQSWLTWPACIRTLPLLAGRWQPVTCISQPFQFARCHLYT